MRQGRDRELRANPIPPQRCQRIPLRLDLIELDGDDLRRDPLAVRKATLASLLSRASVMRRGTSCKASSVVLTSEPTSCG